MANTGAMARPQAHRRLIDCQGWQRDDGLWQIEVSLQTPKAPPCAAPPGATSPRARPFTTWSSRWLSTGAEDPVRDGPEPGCAGRSCREVEASYAALAGLTIGLAEPRRA